MSNGKLYTDYVQAIFDDVIQGQNNINARLTFKDLNSFTFENNFDLPDTSEIFGDWWKDGGDLAMLEADREERAVCKKGKATISFNGRTCILRVFTNPAFGSADVYIDGVKPSTISGAESTTDTIETNSTTLGTDGNEYIDVVLADYLADGDHTLELYCNNTESGNAGYFAISGLKQRNMSNDLISRSINAWILQATDQPDTWTVRFKNIGVADIADFSFIFSSAMTDVSGNAIPAITQTVLSAGAEISQEFTFDFDTAAELSGNENYNGSLSYRIQDDAGDTLINTEFIIDDTDPDMHYDQTIYDAWEADVNNGETRHYTVQAWEIALHYAVYGTSIAVRIQKDYGWGKAEVYVDWVSVGYVYCHDDTGGGFYEDVVFSGLTDDWHIVHIIKSWDDGKPVVFSAFKYWKDVLYSSVNEVLRFVVEKKQVPPYATTTVSVTDNNIVCDTPSSASKDLALPRDNTGLTGIKTLARIPTFCVYYSSGKQEQLKQYDIVIIDPFATSREKVAELQALGIRVLAYISFGEEDGTLTDIYDPSSDLSPYTGDGTGPGGYAGYYCKGGNKFGEVSECKFDNQKMLGVKTCSKGNPNYLTSTGRCSKACQNDWREGFSTQREGGACGEGHTKDTYWDRTASQACSNNECPNYAPFNSGCTEYVITENSWGQDFSIITTDFPDENGIWGSYYIDATKASWETRLKDFYLKAVLDAEVEHTDEVCTLADYTDDEGTVRVCRIAHYAMDPDATITVKSSDDLTTYTKNEDYTFDPKTGTFRFTASGLTAGDTVKISYTELGLQCDGIFMDTVDSVDVYPSDAYKNAFIQLIKNVRTAYPDAFICSNRGFSILDDIISVIEYVMFESFLSDYDWETGVYSKITDTDTVAWNNTIIDQLKNLREGNNFEVFALNYCADGSDGDELREYCHLESRKLGFMAWTSNILLNALPDNTAVEVTTTSINDNFKSNDWRKKNVKSIS